MNKEAFAACLENLYIVIFLSVFCSTTANRDSCMQNFCSLQFLKQNVPLAKQRQHFKFRESRSPANFQIRDYKTQVQIHPQLKPTWTNSERRLISISCSAPILRRNGDSCIEGMPDKGTVHPQPRSRRRFSGFRLQLPLHYVNFN